MPKQHKKIKLLQHPVLSNADRISDDPKQALYVKKKMSPAEYVNLMSGAYGHDPLWLKDDTALKDHPLNNEKNNSKALERLLEHVKVSPDILSGEKDDEEGDVKADHAKKLLHNLIGHHALPNSDIHHIIDNPEDYGTDSPEELLATQPNVKKEHIMKLATDPDRAVGEDLLSHPDAGREVAQTMLAQPNRVQNLSHRQVQTMLDSIKHEDPSKRMIDQKDIENIARNTKNLSSGTFDKLMENWQPEADQTGNKDFSKRKDLMDDLLGISGGKHDRTSEEGHNPDAVGYDNWIHGDKRDQEKAKVIAESKYLTPDQIDHIKRHGTFEEKYKLFNNSDIDPKHSEEMYTNWLNDDSDKNYHLEELRNKIKEENPVEDRYGDLYTDASDEAREAYPFSRYIKENVNDQDLMDGMTPEDWIAAHPDKDYNETLARRQADPPEEMQESLNDNYDEYLRDDVGNKIQEMYDKEMDTAHENPDHLPKHLPLVEEIKRKKRENDEVEARQKATEEENKNKEFLDQAVPNRSHEHAYGDLQHHVEMAKEHADANKGSIDIGHLNKLYPNLKDKWKAVFGNKGKLSSQELDQKLQNLPKTPFAISHRPWTGLQNINERPQVVFRLDHTPESLAPMKQDPDTHKVFNRIAEVSQRSGHPTNANSIAWARVDTNDPKHWMIDEVQSDFGSAARDYLEENGKKDEADAVDKIIKYHKNWREALINHVLKEAKKHGVEKVSTHSPESKAAHTGADKVHSIYKDSYQKVPRSMGFQASEMGSLPLNEEGQKTFRTQKSGTNVDNLLRMHDDAMGKHASQALHHRDLENIIGNEELAGKHNSLARYHEGMYKQHQERLAQLDPSHKLRNAKTAKSYFMGQYNTPFESMNLPADKQEAKINAKENIKPIYGFDHALKEAPQKETGYQGHTYNLQPQTIKKSIDDIDTMVQLENLEELAKKEIDQSAKIKIATTLKSIQDNKQAFDQLQQSNPEAYQSLMALVQSLVDIFQKKSGENAQDLVHKLEIQQQLEEQQQQMQPQQEVAQ